MALVFSMAACRPASGTTEMATPRAVSSQHGVTAVRSLLAASVEAWNRGDLDGHVAVYADSGTGGPPIGAGGRARARANLAPFFTNSRPTLRLDSLMVRPLGRDYVLATGRYTLSGTGSQRVGWFTEIWARTAAGWRIVHDHSS